MGNFNKTPNNNAQVLSVMNAAKQAFSQAGFNPSWITSGADNTLADFADKMGDAMVKGELTNSKIRNVYGEIKRIQMGGFEKNKSSFYLLRPKVAYAVGRDKNNVGLNLFKEVFDEAVKYVKDDRTFHNFCNLMEAILAYHKAHGGK